MLYFIPFACADKKEYEKGIKVNKEEFNKIKISNHVFRGDWNYKITP